MLVSGSSYFISKEGLDNPDNNDQGEEVDIDIITDDGGSLDPKYNYTIFLYFPFLSLVHTLVFTYFII